MEPGSGEIQNNESSRGGYMDIRKIVGMTLLLLMLAPGATAAHKSGKLSGTWIATVSFEGTNFKVLENFTRDGRTTVLLPFGPPFQFETRVGGLGEWRKRAPEGADRKNEENQFDVTLYFFDTQDVGTFLQRSRIKYTLSDDSKHLSGPFKYQVLDLDGNIVFSGDGFVDATPLEVVPLE